MDFYSCVIPILLNFEKYGAQKLGVSGFFVADLILICVYLFQVVVESRSSALEYGDLTVEEGSAVNPDLHFDSQLMHLYVMTEKKVGLFYDHYKMCVFCV
jgi:hypothetical protein